MTRSRSSNPHRQSSHEPAGIASSNTLPNSYTPSSLYRPRPHSSTAGKRPPLVCGNASSTGTVAYETGHLPKLWSGHLEGGLWPWEAEAWSIEPWFRSKWLLAMKDVGATLDRPGHARTERSPPVPPVPYLGRVSSVDPESSYASATAGRDSRI